MPPPLNRAIIGFRRCFLKAAPIDANPHSCTRPQTYGINSFPGKACRGSCTHQKVVVGIDIIYHKTIIQLYSIYYNLVTIKAD